MIDSSIIWEDPSNDKCLYCAVAADADALISGDRHLLKLATFQSIPILTPARLLERIKS